jgi:hypothetical protein
MGEANSPKQAWVAAGAAAGLGLAELLLAALRPASVHRVDWVAPKLAVFLGAYLLARMSWLTAPAADASAEFQPHLRSGPGRRRDEQPLPGAEPGT